MNLPEQQPKKLFSDEKIEDLEQSRSLLPLVILLLVFAAGGGVVFLVQIYKEEPIPVRIVDLNERIREVNSEPMLNTPMLLPGLVKPPAFPPEEANTPDSKEVVGILVGDKSRCYVLDSFTPLGNRVVNDVVNGRPITLLYDPQRDLLRVLTNDKSKEHLGIDMGGYIDGDMFVMVNGKEFKIKNKLPFPDYDRQRVTWKQWREKHPDTDIYNGIGVELPFSNPLNELDLPSVLPSKTDTDAPTDNEKQTGKKS